MRIRIKMIFIIMQLALCANSLDALDSTADEAGSKTADMLEFGIESEIMNLLKELGTYPKSELYPKLLQRYNDALSMETRIAFLEFFSLCKNLPQNIVDKVYADASSDLSDRRLQTSLYLCLGNIGKKREGLFLLNKLDQDDSLIKSIAADSISKMKVPELGTDILKRLEDADKIEEKYLDPGIKSKLILFFGENKTNEATVFLQKIVSDRSAEKYMKMYSMVSLLKIGDISSIKLIAANLGNEDVRIREYAAYSLSLFKNPETIPYLRNMLLDNNDNIRVFGCKGIALNEDYDSVKIVTYKMKNDPAVSVRNEALLTLVNLGQKGINAVNGAFKGQKIPEIMLAYLCTGIAKKTDAAGVNYLIELFNKGDKKDRDVIVRNMTEAASNLLDPLVLLFLNSPDHIHRINGIKIAYQIEKSGLWGKINEIAENDSVKMVKDNAKRFIDMKK